MTQVVVWHVLETARGAIPSFNQNVRLIGQQKSPVTKERIVSILGRLYRLGFGKSGGSAVDKEESVRCDSLLSSVIFAPP